MELSGLITMFIVIGIVWGGLAWFIIHAVKFEKRKRTNGEK